MAATKCSICIAPHHRRILFCFALSNALSCVFLLFGLQNKISLNCFPNRPLPVAAEQYEHARSVELWNNGILLYARRKFSYIFIVRMCISARVKTKQKFQNTEIIRFVNCNIGNNVCQWRAREETSERWKDREGETEWVRVSGYSGCNGIERSATTFSTHKFRTNVSKTAAGKKSAKKMADTEELEVSRMLLEIRNRVVGVRRVWGYRGVFRFNG